MKYKRFFRYALCLATLTTVMTACEKEPEFEDPEEITANAGNFDYNDEGVWARNNSDGFLNIDDFEFSHYFDNSWGYDYISGFTPSKVTDNEYYEGKMFDHPYASISGGGLAVGNQSGVGRPYLVGYWDTMETADTDFEARSCRIYQEDGDNFKPRSVMVNNTSYVYYYMYYGNDFNGNQPFKQGDYLKLIAHGVHVDGSEAVAEFNLADMKSDDLEAGLVKTWSYFDLSSLGVCTGIYFTMESSDANAYGMITPSYFCLDRFIVDD